MSKQYVDSITQEEIAEGTRIQHIIEKATKLLGGAAENLIKAATVLAHPHVTVNLPQIDDATKGIGMLNESIAAVSANIRNIKVTHNFFRSGK